MKKNLIILSLFHNIIESSNKETHDINLVIPSQADDGNMYTVVAEFVKTGTV